MRLRHSEIKVAIAHVVRQLLDGMRPGALRSEAQLRATALELITEMHRHLVSVSSGAAFYSTHVFPSALAPPCHGSLWLGLAPIQEHFGLLHALREMCR